MSTSFPITTTMPGALTLTTGVESADESSTVSGRSSLRRTRSRDSFGHEGMHSAVPTDAALFGDDRDSHGYEDGDTPKPRKVSYIVERALPLPSHHNRNRFRCQGIRPGPSAVTLPLRLRVRRRCRRQLFPVTIVPIISPVYMSLRSVLVCFATADSSRSPFISL